METGSQIVVYRYRYWSPETNEMVESKRMATLDAIKKGLGVAIIESGTKVPVDRVDNAGWFVEPAAAEPVATDPAPKKVTE